MEKSKIKIPYGRHQISKEDIDAVMKVLKSDFLTQGPVVKEFESAVANYCGAQFGIAVNSATSALHIACLALEVGPGDVVWTSPITFVASANCAIYCGAQVDFVDIDPQTYNLSVTCLAEKLEKAKIKGNLPKVVIPVHLCGQSCDMESIKSLADQYGFKIIEDASHAIGGRYKNKSIGSCNYSDITVFSFHPVKIITTGEGGMAVTNNKILAKKMRLYSSHGITREIEEMNNIPHGSWYYEQKVLGFNYRMSDIQAALGLSQLMRIDEFVSKRENIANRYNKLLSDFSLTTPFQCSDSYSSWHLYVIRLKKIELTKSHKKIFDEFREFGVGINLHYIPVYFQPYYQNLGFKRGLCPNAEEYYSEAISLPIYPSMTEVVQNMVKKVIREVLKS